MKKIVFLIILGSILSGCASSKILSIPTDYSLQNKAEDHAVAMGRISVQGVGGEFGPAQLVLENEITEKLFPITVEQGVIKQAKNPKNGRVDYYFFVELPPGPYGIKDVTIQHKTYEILEFSLLNANLTIEKNSVVYIGTLKAKPIARTMSMLGPTLDMKIINTRRDVVREFKRRYPQFKNQKVDLNIISRYGLFKKGGIGGEF